jgi:hypothetical protein
MHPRLRHRVALATVLCSALAPCAPAAAATGTGGSSIPAVIAPSTGGSGYGEPGQRSVVVAPTAMVGELVHVRGTLPGAARRRIILQRLDARHGWRNLARSRVHRTERYDVRWRATISGRSNLRVVLARRRVSAAAAAPVAFVNVYRPGMATFYGPGLFGNMTSCGQLLTPLLLGVAHRTLRCGRRVAILHDGRELIVPVVDRGPFNSGYDWDLTQATADALGFTASGRIGYVRLR